MTLQSSGPITLADIRAEFGGSAPDLLSEYYRGGAYVPSSQTSIPASGEIKLSDFHGATNETVITVTEGSFTGFLTTHGFALANESTETGNTLFGSRSPTSFSGQIIQAAELWSSSTFYFKLSGTLAKSFFTSLTPEGGSLLTSSSATHTQSGGSTTWSWSSSPAGWDGSGTRTVIII